MPENSPLKKRFSQTKIVATVGPACAEEAKLVELIKSGADQATDGSSSYLLMNPKKTIAQLDGAG